MVLVCLSSDALLQHLPSYLGFSYIRRGVSLHGCSSKAQPLLLTQLNFYFLLFFLFHHLQFTKSYGNLENYSVMHKNVDENSTKLYYADYDN